MAEQHQLHVLIVRFGSQPVTFLDRLVHGLAEEGICVSIAGDKRLHSKLLTHRNVDLLWAPSWKGQFLSKVGQVLALLLTQFSYQRLSWLVSRLRGGSSPRRVIAILHQYLPFMKCDPDVIYFPWNSTAIDYAGLYDLGIPVVVSCRGSQVNINPNLPDQETYTEALRESLQKAAAVHCVSAEIKGTVAALGVDVNKCCIIRPAVDPAFFFPAQPPPTNARFRLVSTGSLIWRKAYETMLVALRYLVDAGVDAELHIIGEGPERQHIAFTLHDLGLVDRVTLHGGLAPAKVRHQLQSADIFAFTSLSEGIANAVLEAMSCGLPIVAADCSGMREAITDGVEGLITPLRDPQALAQGLVVLARDPGLRRKMGTAGRQRIIKDFSLDEQVDAFSILFRSFS